MDTGDDHPALTRFVALASKMSAEYPTFVIQYAILMAAARYKSLCMFTDETIVGDSIRAERRTLADQYVDRFREYLERELGLPPSAGSAGGTPPGKKSWWRFWA